MSDHNNEDIQYTKVIQSIVAVIARCDAESVTGNRAIADAARDWMQAGFEDAEEVEDWLRARCFQASAARAMDEAGITPEQAALLTDAGAKSNRETIAYKIACGDLSMDEARRIITNYFWNS